MRRIKVIAIALGGTALLCSLFLFRGPLLAALRREARPQFEQVELDRPFLLGACERGGRADPAEFESLSAAGNCAYAATRRAEIASEYQAGPFGRLPVIVTRPRGADLRSARLVVVDLVGGPGTSIFANFDTKINDAEGR